MKPSRALNSLAWRFAAAFQREHLAGGSFFVARSRPGPSAALIKFQTTHQQVADDLTYYTIWTKVCTHMTTTMICAFFNLFFFQPLWFWESFALHLGCGDLLPGGVVVQWLPLSRHSKKVLGLNRATICVQSCHVLPPRLLRPKTYGLSQLANFTVLVISKTSLWMLEMRGSSKWRESLINN